MRRSLFAIGAAFATVTWGGLNGGCDETEEGCDGQELFLTGGQTIPVGGLHVENDGDTLTVTYGTTDGWLLDEVHLHVACDRSEIPTNGAGNVIPGQFEHAGSFSPGVTSYTFEIPLSSLSCAPACGQEIVLAAHAAVSNPATGGSETAWGSSFDPNDPTADAAAFELGGARWGWYAPYVLECCEDGGGEGTTPTEPTDGGGETVLIDPPADSGGSGGRGGSETYVLPWNDSGDTGGG